MLTSAIGDFADLNFVNAAMAVPPTVALGVANASSTIASSYAVLPNDSRFTYFGGKVAYAGGSYPDNMYYRGVGVTSANNYSCPYVEFETDCDVFEIYEKGLNGTYQIWVDGLPVTLNQAAGAAADGNLYYRLVTFASAAVRRIRVHMGASYYFGGVRVGPNYTVWNITTPVRPFGIAFGDSLFEGSSSVAGMGPSCCAFEMGRVLGLNLWASGAGGTGYIANGGGGGKVKFEDRVQADVIANNPEIVIVFGGVNDTSSSYDQIYAAADSFYSTLQGGLPKAKIFVIGCHAPSTPIAAVRAECNRALSNLCQKRGLIFINPQGMFTGIFSTAGSGSANLYIASDGIHPTPDGHRYYGRRLAQLMVPFLN